MKLPKELAALLRDVAVLDFETLPIANRPKYPPEPTGLAVLLPGKKPKYYAWGHPAGNNATLGEVRQLLTELVESGRPLLFHNEKFDLAVMFERLGVPLPHWDRCHDTLALLYLDDPRAHSLSLKPSAERYLGEPPEERDAIVDWLIEHQPVPDRKLGRAHGKNYAGAYVCLAPVELVGPYAIGDVERTLRLFRHLLPRVFERGMIEAYNREREMLFLTLAMEPQGVRVDTKRLTKDVEQYTDVMTRLDAWIRKKLKASSLNVDSDDELLQALLEAKALDTDRMNLTKTGKLSASKESLALGLVSQQLAHVLRYRAQLATCLRTFMQPWLQTASANDGLIYTTWNTLRSTESGDAVGTRTGRLSSTPNFQNIPNEFEPLFHHEATGKGLPKAPFELPPLPIVRSYIIPYTPDEVLIGRDYSQQELRGLAHFEDGALLAAYLEDPWMDAHDFARDKIYEMLGKLYDRKPVKNTNFGLIYGMGVGKLAMKNNLTVEDAKELKDAILSIFPGLKALYKDMRRRAQANEPVRTWGGREYYCEPAKIVNGRIQEYDYKLLNLIIQGSSADCTKEAMIRYHRTKPVGHRLLMQVHDEILCSVPRRELRAGMEALKVAMESVEFDVPMLSEGYWSAKSWADHDLEDFDKKGRVIYKGKF